MQDIIAFKTYAMCPEEYRLPGVALSFPWIEQAVRSDEEAASLYAAGYTLMTRDQYERYKRANSIDLTVTAAVEESIDFGWYVIREFSKENVLLGITELGMTGQVRENTKEIIEALSVGSLYEAISKSKTITDDKKDAIFITDARLLKYVNMVEDFLEIPRSDTL